MTDPRQNPGSPSRTLELESSDLALRVSGPHSALLKEVEKHSGASVSLRGNSILVVGDDDENVHVAFRFLEDAAELVTDGMDVGVADVAHSLRGLRQNPERSLVELMDQVVLVGAGRKPIAPKTSGQRKYIADIRENDLTFGIGPAGTGKTYLAMAMAASHLLSHKVKRIILTRPAVEAGERLGFLPGDLAEKVNPYLRPLYDAMNDMMDYERIQALRSRNQIEVAPLAFMRGRTLNDCFVILDEAQNATSDQMKMFLTRLGYGSKAVVTGDVTQTDLPRGARSGLRQAREILEGVDGIAFHHFTDVDVVRHPLVQRIVVAYDAHEEAEQRRCDEERSLAGEASQTSTDDNSQPSTTPLQAGPASPSDREPLALRGPETAKQFDAGEPD